MTKVSVVILNYNNYKYSVGAANSVIGNSGLRDYEILLVDNCSKGRDYEKLKKEFAEERRVRVLKTGFNRGFSGGHNFGTKRAKGRYVILLNDDVIVQRNWGKILLDAMTKDDNTAVVGPRAFYPHENPEVEHNRGALNVLLRHLLRPPERFPVFVFIEGASPMFDKRRIRLPFDDDFFIYHEDTYLCLKARLMGYYVKHVPSSRLLHFGSATAGKMKDRTAFLHERNRIWDILLFYQTKNLIKLLPLILLDETASIAKNLLFNRSYVVPQLRAILSLFLSVPKLLKKRRRIQNMRRVSDDELLKYLYGSMLSGSSAIAKFVNSLSLLYLRVVGMRVREFYPDFKKKRRESVVFT